MTTKTATEIVNLNDSDLRAYCVEWLVGKWGEVERVASVAQVAKRSRGQMLGEIAIDFDGKDLKVINKAIKLCQTREDMRRWHAGASE